MLSDPVQHGSKPVYVNWFHKVVECVQIKGTDCIVFMSRHKDDDEVLRLQVRQCLDSAHLRHLDIQEQEVRLEKPDSVDRLSPVSTFGHNLHVAIGRKELPHPT